MTILWQVLLLVAKLEVFEEVLDKPFFSGGDVLCRPTLRQVVGAVVRGITVHHAVVPAQVFNLFRAGLQIVANVDQEFKYVTQGHNRCEFSHLAVPNNSGILPLVADHSVNYLGQSQLVV